LARTSNLARAGPPARGSTQTGIDRDRTRGCYRGDVANTDKQRMEPLWSPRGCNRWQLTAKSSSSSETAIPVLSIFGSHSSSSVTSCLRFSSTGIVDSFQFVKRFPAIDVPRTPSPHRCGRLLVAEVLHTSTACAAFGRRVRASPRRRTPFRRCACPAVDRRSYGRAALRFASKVSSWTRRRS